jgi:serine/threonine protein kinase
MELVEGGSLVEVMKERKLANKPISEEEVKKAMKNILNAVNYIHSEEFVHRDIKPGTN